MFTIVAVLAVLAVLERLFRYCTVRCTVLYVVV
jgi:hypothetical protein